MMSGQPPTPETSEAAGDSAGTDSGAKAPEAGTAAESGRHKRLVTGAAIGIGSAALVAALLYANRSKKSDKS